MKNKVPKTKKNEKTKNQQRKFNKEAIFSDNNNFLLHCRLAKNLIFSATFKFVQKFLFHKFFLFSFSTTLPALFWSAST